MSVTPEDLLTSLEGIRDWNEQYEWIELWAASGEVQLLRKLAQMLESPRSASLTPLVREAIFDYIETALALTPNPLCAQALFRLAALPRQHTIQTWRTRPDTYRQAHLATLLASGQTPMTLAALFEAKAEDPRQEHLLACLAQEMVVRRVTMVGTAVSEFYASHVVKASLLLAWLPLALVSGEQELAQYLPLRKFRSSSCAMPFGPSTPKGRRSWPQPADEADFTAVEAEQPSTTSTEAVVNWTQESNGKVESKVFALNRSITELSVTAFLKLDMECLYGVAPKDVNIRRVGLSEVLNTLFSAAANGGAYNSGHFAAYGRLAAWKSVAGMAGAAENARFKDVAALAEKCEWFLFDAASDWFYQVAWDIGVTTLRPDGRILAALAATDTD